MMFSAAMLAVALAAAGTPEMRFANPPPEAKVGVWWHWMGGQVSEAGIRKDLDWFAETGIGSATIFAMADCCTPWAKRIGNVPGGIRPYDEKWWKLFAFACREGAKRGIDIGVHNCPGYTSTGGPWIPPELAMRELVFGVTNAERQISTEPKALFPVYDEDRKRFGKPECAARRTDIREIGVGRGGIRIAHVPMGAFVQPADWDSFGLECDKMNPAAVKLHLDHVFGELKRHLGDDLPKAGLRHMLLDSYEAGTPNWTPKMREEFTRRRGYDPLEFLPILGGHTNLYSAAETARFRRDFDRTVKDLYRDVLFRMMSERLRQEGLAFANEPYLGPFVAREVAPCVDRLMTEFWYHPNGTRLFHGLKEHALFNTYTGPDGRRHNIVEAEAFTGAPECCQFTETPSTLKASMDDAFLSGVNRLILHSNVLQPWGDDVKPGVTMGRWGVHFGRNQTWANAGRDWYRYAARCQALLQWGEPATNRVDLPLGQFARTEGGRTLIFLCNRGKAAVKLNLRGRWFDPARGSVGRVPAELKAGESGFYERGSDSPQPAAAFVARVALGRFSPELGDWTASEERRFFSGTVAYATQFEGGKARKLLLTLGNGLDQVFNVRVNGWEAGTVWCAPWQIEIDGNLIREGKNILEIDVTNSWHNRLAGDERERSDCEFEKSDYPGGAYLVAYPKWFAQGMKARPSKGRKCFTTWNYFSAETAPLPSGLVGPVELWRSDQ